MDVELSWLKIRAELVAVVLALALLRVHALDLAPVVAPVPVPGVPGARVVAALKGKKDCLNYLQLQVIMMKLLFHLSGLMYHERQIYLICLFN